MDVLRQDRRQLVDQLGEAFLLSSLAAPPLRKDDVQATLDDPPQVGKPGLHYRRLVPARAKLVQGPRFETLQIAGRHHFFELSHRRGRLPHVRVRRGVPSAIQRCRTSAVVVTQTGPARTSESSRRSAGDFRVRCSRLNERTEDNGATTPTGTTPAAAPKGDVAAPAASAAAHTNPPSVVGSSPAGFDGGGFLFVRLSTRDLSTVARRGRAGEAAVIEAAGLNRRIPAAARPLRRRRVTDR